MKKHVIFFLIGIYIFLFEAILFKVLQTGIWNDNQTLDLLGRAQKAARMYNYLTASSLNITLPLSEPSNTVSAIRMSETPIDPAFLYSVSKVYSVLIDTLKGVGKNTPSVQDPTAANSTPPFVNHYPDGHKKLVALNYTAIGESIIG